MDRRRASGQGRRRRGALAPVFDVDTPSLREWAVRVAVKLALPTTEPDKEAIREEAVAG